MEDGRGQTSSPTFPRGRRCGAERPWTQSGQRLHGPGEVFLLSCRESCQVQWPPVPRRSSRKQDHQHPEHWEPPPRHDVRTSRNAPPSCRRCNLYQCRPGSCTGWRGGPAWRWTTSSSCCLGSLVEVNQAILAWSLDVIGTKVLRVFLLAIHSLLYDGFYPFPRSPPPHPRSKGIWN